MPNARDHDRAMQALDNTGFVVGTQMTMAMEQAFRGLAEQLSGAMAAAMAALVGQSSAPHASPAPAPEVRQARADLVKAVAQSRASMSQDADARAQAAARLTPAHAAAILAGAAGHLTGLPDMTAGPLSDESAADYLTLAIAEDPRWAAWMGTVMPIMQEITARG
ncbi:MAG: hypothetical protein KIT68_12440 [Phycisphaeraceae bacterium]|nr:hypothetical protein [Phycisphaeraceae bacterium]